MGVHHPPVGDHGGGGEVDERGNNLQPGGLDGEVGKVLLLAVNDLHAESAGVAAEIPIQQMPDHEGGRHAAQPRGNVAEPDLEGVEVVFGPELGGDAAEDHVEPGKEGAGVEDDEAGFLLEDDVDGSEGVGTGSETPDSVAVRSGAMPALLSQLEVAEEGEAPPRRRDGAVADDLAARFGQGDENEEEDDAGEGSQEPEDGSPALELVQQAADDGTKGWTDGGAHLRIAHLGAPLGGGDDIGDECVGQGDGAAAASALNHA